MRINPYTAVRGQALVEFLVAMMVLIPLFFGMGWVAKILDIQAATHQAARDLAFECAQIGASCPSMVVPTLMQPVLRSESGARWGSFKGPLTGVLAGPPWGTLAGAF